MSKPVDQAARDYAVDPRRNVVLEASAGTGKTRVLVERYVNLLRAGIEPEHILAITFTRKAAAEMRERVIARLREASRLSAADLTRWRDLKDRLGDIEISTIDAFCLALLREFPLEADIDPGFELADDTEVPRLVDEALDKSLRICRVLAQENDDVSLVFAQLGERRLRTGLGMLLGRRLVAPKMLGRYLERGPRDLTAEVACRTAAARLREIFGAVGGKGVGGRVGGRVGSDVGGGDGGAKGGGKGRGEGSLAQFLADGPTSHPQFAMLAADLARLVEDDARAFGERDQQAAFRFLVDRLRGYFLTQDNRPRGKNFTGTIFKAAHCGSEDGWRRHRQAAGELAPHVAEAIRAFRRDLNVVLSRGVWRIFAVTLRQYQQTLDARALVDFSGLLERAVALLENMDEFAQSRFRLEARYRHVLVDEFQDTSRAQWQLVAQLVRSWGEGLGAGSDALLPSIFIVGDRKQSIYGFRDAAVAVLDEAASFVEGLRPDGPPNRAISVSFRAAPALLSFVNDVFDATEKAGERSDRFRYDDTDRFPVADDEPPADLFTQPALGVVVGSAVPDAAAAVADEIARLLEGAVVRDRLTGTARGATPADIAVLFRSRDSHREFEKAIARKGIATYVYKGLGFFDADEVQDAVALIRYLADPQSDLRAAAFLRSRLVRLSDAGLERLAPALADALLSERLPDKAVHLADEDRRVLDRIRQDVPRWLTWVDRATPSDILRRVLAETGYAHEMRGAGWRQARENLKKLGGMVRRFENRGYATLGRVANHLEELAVGDESNAALDARDAVSLMTAHASKGLEFPIVFVVNMGRGTGGIRPPIRVGADAQGDASVSIADFQSEADDDTQARDREETKRLLYVALTRARDRLYLSATVDGGQCRMGRGSLGDVLPASVRALFVAAASGVGESVAWAGARSRHTLIAVRSALAPRGAIAVPGAVTERDAPTSAAAPSEDETPPVD